MASLTASGRLAGRDENRICSLDEALAIFADPINRGCGYYIGARIELPVQGEPGRCFPGYFPVRCDRNEATRCVTSLLGNLGERGARVMIHLRGSSIFIG